MLIVKMIVTLLLGLTLTSSIHAGEIVHLSAILDKNDGQISLQEGLHTGSSVIGHAKFENSMHEKGWSLLEIISTETNVTDDARVSIKLLLYLPNVFAFYMEGIAKLQMVLVETFGSSAW